MSGASNSGDEMALMAKAEICELVQNWVIWRDRGDWERFAKLWHPQGRMATTWFEGPAEKFIEGARAAHDTGVVSQHVLGGSSVTVAGDRAMSDTRMTLHLRTDVDGEECDITCLGRFFDLFVKSGPQWQLYFRQPIYEKDRLDPVRPGVVIEFDEALLAEFPIGYRYMAYAQTRSGMKVSRNLPGWDGASTAPLFAMADRWLAGEDIR